MTTRRNFIKQAVVAGVASSILPHHLFAQEKPVQDMIWANLLHLSYNMWQDHIPFKYRDSEYNCTNCLDTVSWAIGYRPYLTFDETVWNTLLIDMAAAGMNMVVIDLGDAVLYDSHPEIAVRDAWTPEKLKSELGKMRKLGLEPIPKLNFSTSHDIWLGEYSRMVSTKKYYEVCRNLIHEVIDLFDTPRFFHLGMDEERANNQRAYDYAIVRQNDLWWGDLYFFIGEMEKKSVRSWIWSDYAWYRPEIFFKKMPKSVIQSNFFYLESYDMQYYAEIYDQETCEEIERQMGLYQKLEAKGYDQIPTGSNWDRDTNMEATVDYCKEAIHPSRLLGFMMAPWFPTLSPCLGKHQDAIKQTGRVIQKFNKNAD